MGKQESLLLLARDLLRLTVIRGDTRAHFVVALPLSRSLGDDTSSKENDTQTSMLHIPIHPIKDGERSALMSMLMMANQTRLRMEAQTV